MASWLAHWTGADGEAVYDVLSGLGAFVLTLGIFGVAGSWWRQHLCHVHGCRMLERRWLPARITWHPHPEHGHPVCKRHHPHHPLGGGKRVHHSGRIAG